MTFHSSEVPLILASESPDIRSNTLLMKFALYLTSAVWVATGVANYCDVAFSVGILNSGFLLVGFIGLTVLSFEGVKRLRKKLSLPTWFELPAAIVSSVLIMAPGLLIAIVPLVAGGLFSSPSYYMLARDLKCQAEITGGATTAIERVDISLFRRLYFGLERKVAHQNRILEARESVSLEKECLKLATTVTS